MVEIYRQGNYTISSSFGTEIIEGTNPAGANGPVIRFNIGQLSPQYTSFFWQIEPITGSHSDFWSEFFSNRVGGEPADAFANSGFTSSEVTLKINPDNLVEFNEAFRLSFYVSNLDRYNGVGSVANAVFYIVDDEPLFVNGGDQPDYLAGGGGNDTLNGGASYDVMTGGLGNDTYIVDNAYDFVQEYSGGGFDTVYASVNTTLSANVESLVLYGAAVYGTGNAESNYLTGSEAANVLDGGAGADIMSGGGGNDTYVVDNPFDFIAEASGGGFDTVYANANYALGAQVDSLILYGSAVYGTGNAGDNYLVGNDVGNFLNGQGGFDNLTGGAGSDIFQMVGNFGTQVITDFVAGVGTQDAVTFSTAYITSFATVLANSAQIGGDTYIGDGLGNQVVLVGVNRAALSGDDFGFF